MRPSRWAAAPGRPRPEPSVRLSLLPAEVTAADFEKHVKALKKKLQKKKQNKILSLKFKKNKLSRIQLQK